MTPGSEIPLKNVRELAVEHNVPFGDIDENEPRLALPLELLPVYQKLLPYAQGKNKFIKFSAREEQLLFPRYIHISENWNAVKDQNNRHLGFFFINRPDEAGVRKVHPND